MISDEERITNETRPLVLITGASRGIGAQTALRFAEGGWDLALCCKEREDDLRKVADSCESYTGSEVFTFAGAPPPVAGRGPVPCCRSAGGWA